MLAPRHSSTTVQFLRGHLSPVPIIVSPRKTVLSESSQSEKLTESIAPVPASNQPWVSSSVAIEASNNNGHRIDAVKTTDVDEGITSIWCTSRCEPSEEWVKRQNDRFHWDMGRSLSEIDEGCLDAWQDVMWRTRENWSESMHLAVLWHDRQTSR